MADDGKHRPFCRRSALRAAVSRAERRGLLAVFTLSAGQTLLSIHIEAVEDNRLYWWVPAYDPELAQYSPGRLLLENLLADSFARGHAEFDFLVGGNITSGITRRITEKSARCANPPWPFFCAMRR